MDLVFIINDFFIIYDYKGCIEDFEGIDFGKEILNFKLGNQERLKYV